jgi:heterodisulfide reductase subunit A2
VKKKKVIVIGGGVAGMEAARQLHEQGVEVHLLEKESRLGGHLANWDRLFPTRRDSREVLNYLENGITEDITVHFGAIIDGISKKENQYEVMLKDGPALLSDALVLACGYDLFDARKKEEYGFGIYDNVITSAELEEFLRKNKQTNLFTGITSKRVGIVHCVGSRDEKVGNLYCSKLCCITGVKQAIEIKELLPDAEIFSFYMDLRMSDRHFEEMYYEAQQKWGIHFIRGRLSEASENPDQTILVKVEDTLTGLPLKMTVDLLILLVGFVPRPETRKIAEMLKLAEGDDGFISPEDPHTASNSTGTPGVFLCGTLKGPASIENTIADARAAVLQVVGYLEGKS